MTGVLQRSLYNGILAQQHPDTGMIAYFLPLQGGAVKQWGSRTEDFWCCHGTLVQAQTMYTGYQYLEDAGGLLLNQYIPSEATWTHGDAAVTLTLTYDPQHSATRRPSSLVYRLKVASAAPAEFTLKLRVPWWVDGAPEITVNDERVAVQPGARTVDLCQRWHNERICIELPKRLTTSPLPDMPQMVAFMDGPVVLAGLCDEERTLYGDPAQPESMLTRDNEREWTTWQPGYRTQGQPANFRFVPLYNVRDERYTVYFPVEGR